MYGLSSYEDRVLATMPPRIRAATAFALEDRSSRPEVIAILRSGDPVGNMGRELNLAVKEAFVEAGHPVAGGMGALEAGMGKSLRKRLKKAVSSVVKTVKTVHQKLIPKPLKKIDEKIRKTVSNVQKKGAAVTKKVFVKYGNIIIPVAGAILAPFTGGASLVAAAALSAGHALYKQKEAAREAVRLQKADANIIAAEAAKAEVELGKQADDVYNQYPQSFQALGISWSKWSGLSVDAKIAIINALSEGRLPPGYSYVSEAEAAAAGAAAPQAGGGAQPPVGPAPAPAPYYPDYAQQAQQKAYQNVQQAQAQQAQNPYTAQIPVTYTQEQEEKGGVAGSYQVLVEGKQVGTATSSDEAAALAMSSSSPGDLVEVIANGSSSGLQIRSAAGMMAVPADVAAKVKEMSRAERAEMVNRAAGQEAPKGGFSLWWLLAIPAALVAAKGAA